MSGKRRHSVSGKRVLTWVAWGALVVLLGGNFVMALVNQKGETPQGFLTPEILQTAAFWIPIGAAMLMSLLGLYWSNKAYTHNERSSLLWARRGYVFSLVGSVALSMAVFDEVTFPREWLAGVAAAILGGQTICFAMLALREYRRAETGEGSRRARPQPDDVAAPVTPAKPAGTPGQGT